MLVFSLLTSLQDCKLFLHIFLWKKLLYRALLQSLLITGFLLYALLNSHPLLVFNREDFATDIKIPPTITQKQSSTKSSLLTTAILLLPHIFFHVT